MSRHTRLRSPLPTPRSSTGASEQSVWMSHGDSVTAAPAGYARGRRPPGRRWRRSRTTPPAVRCAWHPEVMHWPWPAAVLENFLWQRRQRGGLDSSVQRGRGWSSRSSRRRWRALTVGCPAGWTQSVAAALVQRAVGDSRPACSSTTGCCGEGEAEQVEGTSWRPPGSTSSWWMRGTGSSGAGRRHRPGEKRKIIGAGSSGSSRRRREGRSSGRRGTRWSSWSGGRSTPTSSSPAAARVRPTSSRHHNVGGLPRGPAVPAS